jgi:hypothetical protein
MQFAEAKVDAIVAISGALAIRAAQAATQLIPIIGVADDMVSRRPRPFDFKSRRQHYRDQHPFGSTRWQAAGDPDELLPSARRMAVIFDAAVQLQDQMKELGNAARGRGVVGLPGSQA